MNAIESQHLKNEPFYDFLNKNLKTEEFEVFPLAGDASNRRYYRVAHGENSSVLMVWEPFEDNAKYPFLSVLQHFQKYGIQVPVVRAKSPQEGLVLLEDLGDLTLERKFWENQNQDVSLPFYKDAIDELIKIHYPASHNPSESCTAFHNAFDTEKLLWEMNYARTHLLEGVCKIKLNTAASNQLTQYFTSVCEALSQLPRVICHRDYHSRNLMIKLGKMRVIDFQDARMGSLYYDLVSLFRDSYVDLNDQSQNHLIEYYLARRAEYNSLTISKDEFMKFFELQTVQRCFKACGSFASFFNSREDRRYLKYLPKTLKQVETSLSLFPEAKSFLNLLKSEGVIEREYLKL